VKRPKLLRGAPAAGEAEQQPRRRRRIRPDAPRTIIPIDDDAPSKLPAPQSPSAPMALDLDAARERLRRRISPISEDDDC
jgi:hypothetical protein